MEQIENKSTKFNEFAKSLLPIEAELLRQYCKFEDAEKNQILQILLRNASKIDKQEKFPEYFDKRKYSFVKQKCTQILEAHDVDKILERIQSWEQAILLDKIEKDQEKLCLQMFKHSSSNHFHFIKLYELARIYRHYLSIRMKLKDFHLVQNYLNQHELDYNYAKTINDKLNASSVEIVEHYIKNAETNDQWFDWLSEIFFNELLDGQSRILAWIRLIFISHNRKNYEPLKNHFHDFEKNICSGKFYSKRILSNFYSQFVLYHTYFKNLNQAIFYGYQSIKIINNDYLYYINNLAAVLLRANRPADALDCLKLANTIAKQSSNDHNKIGHAAFTIFAYIDLKKYQQAQTHAFIFYRAFRKEILEHRWHLFFSAYFKALLLNKEYQDLLKIAQSCHLVELDASYQSNSLYRPNIPWMIALAKFKTKAINLSQLNQQIQLWSNNKSSINSDSQISELIELNKIVVSGK